MNVQDSIAISAKDLRLFMRRIKKALSDLKREGEEVFIEQQPNPTGDHVDEIFSSLMED